MFRFTIRDVLWLTVVVAMGVTLWVQQRNMFSERQKLATERASLGSERKKVQAMTAQGFDFQKRMSQIWDARIVPSMLPETEVARAIEESAKLGAPQPKPLPPGYGETPKKEWPTCDSICGPLNHPSPKILFVTETLLMDRCLMETRFFLRSSLASW
jgi:hypothetical protein